MKKKDSSETSTTASSSTQATKEVHPYPFEASTVQANPIKNLIDSLSNFLMEANLEFSPSGIKILAIDPNSRACIHLKLNSENFETYYCEGKRIVGVSFNSLRKITHTIESGDSLRIIFPRDDQTRMSICIYSNDKPVYTNYDLKFMRISEEPITLPNLKYRSMITMPSSLFHKTLRDLSSVGVTCVNITTQNEIVIFDGKSEISEIKASRIIKSSDEQSITFENKNNENSTIINASFNLKILLTFAKCSNLGHTVNICMDNDAPITINSRVGSLGELHLILVPRIDATD